MFQNILDNTQGPGSLKHVVSSGIVVDNNDPEQLDRAKVRISDLHSGRDASQLVWAMSYKYSPQGHTSAIGSVGPPVIGSKVLVYFPEDDEHDIYYVADYHDASTKIPELLTDYPNCYGYIDASGNLFFVNTLRDTITMIHVSGSFTKYFQNGDMQIAAAGNLDMYCVGNFSLRAGGTVNIDGANVYLNSGNSIPLTVAPRTKPTAIAPPSNDY